MISETAFLVELIVSHKLSKSAKDAIVSRLKDIDIKPPSRPVAQVQAQIQAPSTLLNLEKDPVHPSIGPMQAALPIVNRIVGGEVNTGNGTRGPRKF